MTIRGLLAAVMLIAGMLDYGGAAAAGNQGDREAAFSAYFEAAARNAGYGARNLEIRQRRIAAVLSPLVTRALVQQPGQVDAIMRGLVAAAPDVTPGIASQAMTSFPGFANQIAHAAGLNRTQLAMAQTFTAPRPSPALRVDPIANRANGQAARVAAWAISAIAGDPGAKADIMGRAIAAVPGGEVAVVAAVQAAYPGFAPQIAAAAAPRSMSPQALSPRPFSPVPKVPTTVIRQAPSIPAVGAQLVAAAPTDQTPMSGTNEDITGIGDPLEPMNRITFAFNDTVDLILLRPVAIGYNWIMPGPAIHAVRRFFLNLDAPVITVNDLLQGDLANAGVTLGRFGINSTIGLLGLFDPAAGLGLERHHADFGQTLHSHDVGPGPYLVLPLFGPASTRGGAGKVVDVFFQPLTYLLSTFENLGVAATRAVVKREILLDPLDELRENSIDYYTGLKSAFWQARQVDLNKAAVIGKDGGDVDKLFDAAK